MITAEDLARIEELTREMWAEKVRTESFLELTQGKERGHRIADFVDDCTTSLLKSRFDTRFQAGAGGGERSRSMGDV